MTKWINTATSEKGGKKYSYSPRLFPYTLANGFTMDGKCRVYHYYKNHIRDWAEPLEVGADDIRKGINAANERLVGYYDMADECFHALLTDDYDITGNTVVVLGCVNGWYVAMALAYGAKGVVVVTERDTKIDDERVVIARPDQLKAGFADYVISACSLQDKGFGKYGDELNPDADVEWLEVGRESLKVGGKCFLSVPCGADMVVWNKGRVYGKHRLKKLMGGWTLAGTIGFDEKLAKTVTVDEKFTPLFILEKQ